VRQIECERNKCGQTTFLVDEKYTLYKDWSAGTSPLCGATFYVCPHHRGAYILTAMPSAMITAPQVENLDDSRPEASASV
jgi:hypothetical protein